MNIVLIGYRCSGKTSVGRIVAKDMDKSFMDTDSIIEDRAGSPIEDIISKGGWQSFREIEKEVIKGISDGENLVIATGGGVVMDKENVRNLKKNGFLVWLKGSLKVLKERMDRDIRSGQGRPSLTGEDPLEEIKKVVDIRDPLYSDACDYAIDTSHLSVEEVAGLIIHHVISESN